MDDLLIDLEKFNYTLLNGVLIKPRKLYLRNSYEGKSFREKITIQNMASNPVTVCTVFPNSLSFSVDRNIFAEQLCAGLTTTIWVSYTHSHNSAMLANLAVYINKERTDIPIEVLVPEGVIYCEPRNLNFGQVNINAAVHVQKLRLYNKGNRQAKFEFDVSHNNLGLTIIPKRGYIQGQDSIEVEVDLIGFEEGVFTKEIWIKSEKPTRFTLYVEVITPKLYICSPHEYTENFLPIMFPNTYSGCRVTHNFEVFNLNMSNTTYIIVPEYNFQVMAAHKVQELDPAYKIFHFTPIEGNLEPNEGRQIEISFNPKMRKLKNDQIYFICFRLIRLSVQTLDKIINEQKVQQQKIAVRHSTRMCSIFNDMSASGGRNSVALGGCRVSISSIFSRMSILADPTDIMSISPEDPMQRKTFGDFIRICIYACVKSLKVEMDPIQFVMKAMLINTELEADLTIYNKSRSLPLFFEYVKVGYIKVVPSEGFISVLGSVKLKVIFAPKAAGVIDKPIKFNFLYYSQELNTDSPELKKVGSAVVPVHIPVKLRHTEVQPKFNMGITPKVANEVGFMTDDVRFNSKVKIPKMIVQQYSKHNPSRKLGNAKIAFPNDRPKALQPWRNKDIKCKTIFAGLPRAVAPPDQYMLTNDELLRKLKNDEYFLEYIHELRENRLAHEIYIPWEDYIENKRKLLQKIDHISCRKHWEKKAIFRNKFGTLKPIEIHFVSISPTKIKLTDVAANSVVTYSLDIFNENAFPVHVLLTPFHQHTNIFPDLPYSRTIKSNEKVTLKHKFCALGAGSYSSILNVYLNNVHLVPILLQAEVVKPCVKVDHVNVIFDDKDPSYRRAIPLRNVLNIPVTFNWKIPDNSCYEVQPMKGTIPPKRSILCEMLYTPDFGKRNCVKLVVNSTGNPLNLHLNACYTNCYVQLMEHKVEIPHIPINIPTERKVLLRNYGEEMAVFKIKNSTPCSGISISPETGFVNGRCDAEIIVRLFFQAFYTFSYKIEVDFEYEHKTSFLISGAVDFPELAFTPFDKIDIKRVPAESIAIIPFCIKNAGSSLLNLSFSKKHYPELTISGSNSKDISLAENIELRLEMGETAQLYVHYYPLDVGMTDIYLPVVINNIIGPAEKLEEDSTFLHRFVSTKSFSIGNLEDRIDSIPCRKKQMIVLNLHAVSTKHILRFSKLYFRFKYIPTLPSRAVTNIEFKIKNCIKNVVEFCMDISKMSQKIFDLTCTTPENVVHRDEEVMCFLMDEEEEISLEAEYIPSVGGDHVCIVPIYIKGVRDGLAFNYLRFRALHPTPTFKCPRWIFLEPVPTDVTIVFDIRVTLCHHYPNCKLNVSCEGDQLNIQVCDLAQYNISFESQVILKLSFKSPVPMAECKKLNVGCSCGVDFFIIVGVCAADDVLTSYGYYCPCPATSTPKEAVLKSRGYPYFPEDSNNSEYAKYMRKCVKVVERWIFEQALYKTYYYKLPDDMSGFCRTEPKKKLKSAPKVLVLVKILQNLCSCADDLTTIPSENLRHADDVCRVNALHSTFKHILSYLTMHKVYIPQIRGHYLMSYDDYLLYMKKVRPERENYNIVDIKPKEAFYRRSKQCWLDLMLKVYKYAVFSRIQCKGKSRSSRISGNATSDSNISIRRHSSASAASAASSSSVGINIEKVLLNWLKYTFRQEKDSLMKLEKDLPKNFELDSKEIISNFTDDLSDSLVFIAVTKYYCPYLSSYLEDIYVNVDAEEKAYHNAIKLIQAWKLINVSFKIEASEIVKPIALQMLMLVVFMYDFFPTLFPKEELYYSIGLSKSKTEEIIIKNKNNTELHYEIRFIDNEHNCFKALTPSNIIRVLPGKSFKLRIQFRAKFLKSSKGAVLLCGDVPGQPYSKSMAYYLFGTPHFMDEHERFIFEVDLYQSKEIEFVIHSPYSVASTYDILFTQSAPMDVTSDNLIPVKDYLYTIRPRTFYAKQYNFETDDAGAGVVTISVCCFTTYRFETTIIFTNNTVGEFFVSLVIRPVNFDHVEKYVIPIDLPDDFDGRMCNCCEHDSLKNKARCDRRFVLKIPCKNDQFWSIIVESIMQCVPNSEKKVWETFIETEMGPHILRWLLYGSQEQRALEHLCEFEVNYIVNNTKAEINLPEIVTITNVRSDNFVNVEMHAAGDISKISDIDFSLQSEDGIEFRWYKIVFNRENRESLNYV